MLKTTFLGIEMKNPVIASSGCFGFGLEYKAIFDPNILGAVTLKGLTLEPREGNPQPRVTEIKGGLLNSIGLENPGIVYFKKYTTISLKKGLSIPSIANISGDSVKEFVELTEQINDVEQVAMIEVNASCPNIHDNGSTFGSHLDTLRELVKAVKAVARKPIIIKLTPNVVEIGPYAKVCEDEGADAISLINTVLGMAIDIKKRAPLMKRKFAGMSGNAIKPIALRCVYQAREATSLPIIGMGGIETATDVIEFLMAGSNLVALGSVFFKNPLAAVQILKELEEWCQLNNIKNIKEIVGAAHHGV